MEREIPQPKEARAALVKRVLDDVKSDKSHWSYAHKRMVSWRKFARGLQWQVTTKESEQTEDAPYVANVTMRHIKQRTAATYARNPRFNWRRSRRLNYIHWDGMASSLAMAQQAVMAGLDPAGLQAAIIQEALGVDKQEMQIKKHGETLAILFEYNLKEQAHNTKRMMKRMVDFSEIDGAGYVKLGFQRVMQMPPEFERAIADHTSKLTRLQQIADDLSDDELDENSAEAEEIAILIKSIEDKEQIVLREGLTFDYPDATRIIPDKNMEYLPEFVGCERVTEEYILSPEEVQQIYGVSIKTQFVPYRAKENDDGFRDQFMAANGKPGNNDKAAVWEVWDKRADLIYTVCDGYPEFLEEPHEPEIYTERFWPWFVFAPNALPGDHDPFPLSDVQLIMPMQREINRAGEGLRTHRFAARPGHVTGSNVTAEDAASIENRAAHEVVVLRGLTEDEDISKKFQPFPTSPIDPNLYQTGPQFTDIQRTTGSQEANFGGTSKGTATEASISEAGRQSTDDSSIDELDDLLTDLGRTGGQILQQEVSEETVVEIVGPGAVWPEQSRTELAREIFLEVEAGSSGRPNQAQKLQTRTQMYPLLVQIPGISAEWLARDALKTMDDNVIYEDAIDMAQLSILAQNGVTQAEANKAPEDQGSEGSSNAPSQEPGGQQGPQPPPAPGVNQII